MKTQTARTAHPRPALAARTAIRRPDLSVVAWLRLVRVYQKVQQATVDQLREALLSVGQFDVLAQVGAAEGATQQQVADALLVTKSNVCQLLDRMERAGLVERRQHGRTNLLYLTPEGKRLHDRIVPAHERQIAEQLAALTADEQSALLQLLRKLDRALG
jgi:DNA-binding MarR family transcriptional regulator